MKNDRIKQLILGLSVLLAAGLITGCKSEGNGILGKQTISSNDEDPLLKNAPFAYDYVGDTISYNSCVIGGVSAQDPVGLHGLKIGSSEGFVDNLGTGSVKSGLKLRSDFLQYVGINFSADYPSNTITSAQVTRLLNTSYSIFNKNAFLQFAIRRKSDYAAIPDLITPPIPVRAQPSRDAVVFPQVLSTGYLGQSITKSIIFAADGKVLAEGPRVYNLSETSDSVPIEGSFNLNATTDETSSIPGFATEPYGFGEAYAQKVRDNFNAGTQLLTATFGGVDGTSGAPAEDVVNNTINNIKRPYKTGTNEFDTAKAFGRGYQLKFESQTTVVSWPKSRLTKITEIALDTGTPVGGVSWTCEQFVIATPSHWNNTKSNNSAWVKNSQLVEPNCAPLLADDTTCLAGDSAAICALKANRLEKIKKIRRHYSVDAWNIGLMFPAATKSGYALPPRINNSVPSTPMSLEMCVSPKSSNQCYLPTVGILSTSPTVPADASLDVGIQYDRGLDCYQTMANISGNLRDAERKKGRCAQFASICTRN